jgi:hypothetical protein
MHFKICILKKLIRSEYMINEETQSIIQIYSQYSEIFHLEGDHLTFTNAAEHNIKLRELEQPFFNSGSSARPSLETKGTYTLR